MQPKYTSRSIFNPVAKRKAGKRSPNPMGRETAFSFDQAASLAVSKTRLEALIGENPPSDVIARGWTEMPTQQLLQRIYDEFLSMPTVGDGTIGSLAKKRGVTVIVGILPEVDVTLATAIYSSADGDPQVVIPVRMRAAAGGSASSFLFAAPRWVIARRKFSVPNAREVGGPYLGVIAIDDLTGVTLRARLWPIALTPHGDHFQTVRSGPERIAAEMMWELGVPFFTPLRHSELVTLQNTFGALWEGNLERYSYLPDAILLPPRGLRVGIFELFGMAGFRRYAERQTGKKQLLHWGHEQRAFLAYPLELERRSSIHVTLEIMAKLPRLVASWMRKAA